MAAGRQESVTYQVLEIEHSRYAVLPEARLRAICRRARLAAAPAQAPPDSVRGLADLDVDAERLAERLVRRRKRAGLTQAELARRAGVRVETLNRIERGRTTPDFATIRKLVIAMNEAEAAVSAT